MPRPLKFIILLINVCSYTQSVVPINITMLKESNHYIILVAL